MPFASSTRQVRRHGFAEESRGSAVVEFAFLATILLVCVAGAFDLISISAANREIERSTTQVAGIITSCPPPTTPGFGSCVTDTIRQYTDRKINALIRYPDMSLSIVQINKVAGAIKVCSGTATYLEADVQTKAISVMSDKDVAFAVTMYVTYKPQFSVLTKLFTGTSTNNLRGFTIAVQQSNAVIC